MGNCRLRCDLVHRNILYLLPHCAVYSNCIPTVFFQKGLLKTIFASRDHDGVNIVLRNRFFVFVVERSFTNISIDIGKERFKTIRFLPSEQA